ncbi:osmoprotectant transport system permease protein [Amycolatopsis sulphurea]|uniref:Osmoprotectant transport system permease protein n=1 Tax=Amycolatopsis sulphurea TaxID=76022 RepID=A0A2A9FB92_9PSEU|nr:ABC transporter permease [Amycolatopsis sulphurea]PFG48213.1 osmoprotectant transport system permease protein [Amycolatopsis sulphurea]
MTATVDTGFSTESGSRRAERVRLLAQPAAVVLIVAITLIWVFASGLTATEKATLNATSLLTALRDHVAMTVVVTAIVVLVAVPLGVMVTRPWARWLAPVFLAVANIGQAAPALGVLVLWFIVTGATGGLWVAALPLAFYSLLPVLRNTMVGLQQVDPSLVDAGRGIGMSSSKVLWRVEFPLAIPLILAGLRTSLVLAVGTATFGMFVNAGGFGLLIDTGYKLNLTKVLITGSVLAVALALLVDWLGAVAEQFFGPKGLR